jgi:GMP synthase-like glutamine amidotransferase
VLGLCFGGQALATVLGGEVKVMSEPELGWHRLETDASELVAEGPWLQWHYESFTTPPGADELARSATGPQAFRAGPHLGVQFHPESTAAIVAQWARKDRDRLPRPLEKYLAELETGSLRHGQQAVEAAHRLFDGFWCGRDYNGGVTCA